MFAGGRQGDRKELECDETPSQKTNHLVTNMKKDADLVCGNLPTLKTTK